MLLIFKQTFEWSITQQICICVLPEQGIVWCNMTCPNIIVLWDRSATFKSEKHNIMRHVRKVKIPSKRFSLLHSNKTYSRACAVQCLRSRPFPQKSSWCREAHQSLTNRAEEKNRGITRKNQTENSPHPWNEISPSISLGACNPLRSVLAPSTWTWTRIAGGGGRDEVINRNADHRTTKKHLKRGGGTTVPDHHTLTKTIWLKSYTQSVGLIKQGTSALKAILQAGSLRV
jgi:hypothetical protein